MKKENKIEIIENACRLFYNILWDEHDNGKLSTAQLHDAIVELNHVAAIEKRNLSYKEEI